jgi:hypothetical protein
MSALALLSGAAAAARAAQESEGGGGIIAAIGAVGLLIELAVIVVVIAGLWKTFDKAGEPGWAAIVPIYNLIVLVKIAGKETWWVILLILPCINFIMMFPVSIAVAEKFGKSTGFGIGLALLPFIFYPILGFGSAQYQGARA